MRGLTTAVVSLACSASVLGTPVVPSSSSSPSPSAPPSSSSSPPSSSSSALAPNPTGTLAQEPEPSSTNGPGRLIFIDTGLWKVPSNGRILSTLPDGSDVKEIITGLTAIPDSAAVDLPNKHIYWTNMGLPTSNDGYINRANLDGSNVVTIIKPGDTFTPKQVQLSSSGKLYWSDREGMRVMRANKNGSDIEVLLQTGSTDADRLDEKRWCVGLALDEKNHSIYWTQKGPSNGGQGGLFRMPMQTPSAGQSPANRTDVQQLLNNLPEPIDVELDVDSKLVYWSDRGNPPDGNSINKADFTKLNPNTGFVDRQIIVRNLSEGIGLTLDKPNNRIFFDDYNGSVYSSALDGSQEKKIFNFAGKLTGTTWVPFLSLSLYIVQLLCCAWESCQ